MGIPGLMKLINDSYKRLVQAADYRCGREGSLFCQSTISTERSASAKQPTHVSTNGTGRRVIGK